MTWIGLILIIVSSIAICIIKGKDTLICICTLIFGCIFFITGIKNYSAESDTDTTEYTEAVTEGITTENKTTTEEVTIEEETEEATTEDSTEIDGLEYQAYWDMAKEIVKSCMKNPDSADFPSSVFGKGDIAMAKNGHLVIVQSYVVGTNSFGASIKTNFEVEFLAYDTENFIYDLVYMKLGDDVVGEYVDINEWKE